MMPCSAVMASNSGIIQHLHHIPPTLWRAHQSDALVGLNAEGQTFSTVRGVVDNAIKYGDLWGYCGTRRTGQT